MKQSLLRSGYTTGTCAAAAAKAAAFLLLTGQPPSMVTIFTPKGEKAIFFPESVTQGEYDGMIRVQKDAGDDPDVTHGAYIYASVSHVSDVKWLQLMATGRGYGEERALGSIYIDGGVGIGVVTKRGLSCPVGHYAINPTPRSMIYQAVREICREQNWESKLLVQIMIPEGLALAQKTFNPKLGIEGGISVLGTSGIVEPMSEDALIETIRLEVRMKALEGLEPVFITPGNYGEDFLNQTLHIPLGEAIKCSNFIGKTMDILVEEGVGKVCLAGHIGKLIKVAAGMKNTHSKYGDGRLEHMAKIGSIYSEELTAAIVQCNTTEEAIGLLQERHLGETVLKAVAKEVQQQLFTWCEGKVTIEVVTFSTAYGILGMTDGVGTMLEDRR